MSLNLRKISNKIDIILRIR